MVSVERQVETMIKEEAIMIVIGWYGIIVAATKTETCTSDMAGGDSIASGEIGKLIMQLHTCSDAELSLPITGE